MKPLFLNALATVIACVFFMSAAHANSARNRADQWDFTLIYKDQSSAQVKGPLGSAANFSSDSGWGFSLGYNMDNHLNLSYEFAHNQPRYQTLYTDKDDNAKSFKHKADFYTNNFNVTYHIFSGRVTPFVSGGIGWAYIDSNISDGYGYCYPSYYWGWYCNSSTYSESNWSYNANVGLRADLSRSLFLRGSYGKQWIDFSGSSSDSELDIVKFELGFRFY